MTQYWLALALALALALVQSTWRGVAGSTIPQQLTVREECANGTLVGYVQVPEAFRDKPYTLRVIKYPPDLFTINGTAIYTKARVDRETLCDTKPARCPVYISVNAEPAALMIPKLVVLVEDVNDNAPHFSGYEDSEYSLQVSELLQPNASGSVFELPLASDDDQRYGVQNYRLLDRSDEFMLGVQRREDGEVERVTLALRRQLDRERRDSYMLRLAAVDGSDQGRVHTATLTVRVSVTDANDHRPVFSQALYRVTIPEDFSLQTTFLTVAASDADLDRNAHVTYELAPSAPRAVRDKFTVERDSGDVKLRDLLDFETQRSYIIPVVACDQAQPPLCGNATIDVQLTDVNDEAPHIVVAYENDAHTVREALPPGTIVAFVTVTDRDSGVSGIGGVKCTSDNAKFALLPRAGPPVDNFTVEFNVITTNVQLDRERATLDQLGDASEGSDATDPDAVEAVVIHCEDGGEDAKRQTHSITLTFVVLDVNDNAPYFLVNGRRSTHLDDAEVKENAPRGTPIKHLEVRDDDSGDNAQVTFTLSGVNQDLFAVDRTSGLLTTRRELDREAAHNYTFNVTACDRASPPLCSTLQVTVTVLDVNDCVPTLVSPADFVVRESTDVNIPIGRLQALDRDASAANHKVGFQEQFGMLPDENLPAGYGVADMFYVEQSGEIRLKKTLDREMRELYRFVVRMYDYGEPQRSALVNVTVHVLDANDNDPRPIFIANAAFPIVNGSVAISYLEPVGARICDVRASDADASVDRVTFSLRDGNADGAFRIDPLSGAISLDTQLTAASVGSTRVLTIEANDGSRRGLAQLHVIVDDEASRVLTSRNVRPPRDDSDNDSMLSTKSVLAICICVMIIVLMIGLFTFIYVKYFYETIDKRHKRPNRTTKQKQKLHASASPTSSGSPHRAARTRARRHGPATVEDKQRALIAALRDPESNASDSELQGVSIMSDGELDARAEPSLLQLQRMCKNPLNQLVVHPVEAGDYAALDQLSDAHLRQYSALPHATVHDAAALRSLTGSRQPQQHVHCSLCSTGEPHVHPGDVWHQRTLCATHTHPHPHSHTGQCHTHSQSGALDSLLSRTSNNQDTSTVNSARDDSGSDNNAAFTDRCRTDDTGESGSEARRRLDDRSSRRRTKTSKRTANESRAFSTAERDSRLALRNTPSTLSKYEGYARAPQPEYAQYTRADCSDMFMMAGLHVHPLMPAACYQALPGSPQPNVLATIGSFKRSESFLSSQLGPDAATQDAVAMCTLQPADHQRLLVGEDAHSHWRDNQNDSERERHLEDVNANKLTSVTPSRTANAASRLLASRVEPETSYV